MSLRVLLPTTLACHLRLGLEGAIVQQRKPATASRLVRGVPNQRISSPKLATHPIREYRHSESVIWGAGAQRGSTHGAMLGRCDSTVPCRLVVSYRVAASVTVSEARLNVKFTFYMKIYM